MVHSKENISVILNGMDYSGELSIEEMKALGMFPTFPFCQHGLRRQSYSLGSRGLDFSVAVFRNLFVR